MVSTGRNCVSPNVSARNTNLGLRSLPANRADATPQFSHTNSGSTTYFRRIIWPIPGLLTWLEPGAQVQELHRNLP